MKKQTRKHYTADFKAKVVREMLKEEKTIGQLASEYEVHSNMLYRWREQMLAGLPGLFSDQTAQELAEKEARWQQEREALYAEIGRLTTQVSWLGKKPSGQKRRLRENGLLRNGCVRLEPEGWRPMKTARKLSLVPRRFYRPDQHLCPECQSSLRRAVTLSERTVITLQGALKIVHAGYRCPRTECIAHARTYHSTQADALALPGFTFGLDVVLLIGYLRLGQHQTVAETHRSL